MGPRRRRSGRGPTETARWSRPARTSPGPAGATEAAATEGAVTAGVVPLPGRVGVSDGKSVAACGGAGDGTCDACDAATGGAGEGACAGTGGAEDGAGTGAAVGAEAAGQGSLVAETPTPVARGRRGSPHS